MRTCSLFKKKKRITRIIEIMHIINIIFLRIVICVILKFYFTVSVNVKVKFYVYIKFALFFLYKCDSSREYIYWPLFQIF